MPAYQSSYAGTHAIALEGMIANSEVQNEISRIVESVAGIGFGKVACQGVADDGIVVSAANGKYRGITVATPDKGTSDLYAQYSTAAVMTKGVIWVQASVAVAVGDPVYFVPATGVLTNVSTSNTQIPNAIWDSSTSGAALAKIRLN